MWFYRHMITYTHTCTVVGHMAHTCTETQIIIHYSCFLTAELHNTRTENDTTTHFKTDS